MQDFAIGDKVKCVEEPGTGQLNTDEVYEITYVTYTPGTCGYVELVSVNKWPQMLWNARRFEFAG